MCDQTHGRAKNESKSTKNILELRNEDPINMHS